MSFDARGPGWHARCVIARRDFVLFVAFAGVAALGCGTTTGSAWVREPEPGPFASDEAALTAPLHSDDTFDEPMRSRWAPDEESRVRPRLDRTITLGETGAATSERPAEGRAAESGPISITINNYLTSPRSDQGYYVAPVFERAPVQRAAPARPTEPGQDWPALPSYGPAFPFRTAPASPWAPAR